MGLMELLTTALNLNNQSGGGKKDAKKYSKKSAKKSKGGNSSHDYKEVEKSDNKEQYLLYKNLSEMKELAEGGAKKPVKKMVKKPVKKIVKKSVKKMVK